MLHADVTCKLFFSVRFTLRRFPGEHEQVRAAPAFQLNFLQHVFTILKQHGRAATVVPDNVLFEGGAGETVRAKRISSKGRHTCIALVKANRSPRTPQTSRR
jgi:type I restriction-modification system DNA methylase subunit